MDDLTRIAVEDTKHDLCDESPCNSCKAKPPKVMTLAKLDVLVMPTGEILCGGSLVGYTRDLGQYLSEQKEAV